MIRIYTFSEWAQLQLKSKKYCTCFNCDGNGEIEEDVQSSSGNYHTIYEHCECCDGSGRMETSEVPDGRNPFKFEEYKLDTIKTLRLLSEWKRIDFFELLCGAKGIFDE